MRIVFLAVDDEFAGAMQTTVFARHPEWVVGSVISTHSIYRKSPLEAFWFVLRKSGFRYGWEMFKIKVLRKISGAATKSLPSQLAAKYGVPTHFSADINGKESLKQLRKWQPDLVIATNFSHYVGAAARGVAKIGTWNLHKSYLPKYRGMAPSFYALLNGETQTGVTLHKIEKSIDTGSIVRQTAVNIAPNDTVYTLNQKTSEAGGRMLAEVLEVNLDSIECHPQAPGEWPYYTYPTPKDVRQFIRRGLRF